MKLKNILLVFSILLAFSSCSKEEEGVRSGKGGNLSIKVVAAGGSSTRAADEHELPGEARINNLTAVVFNENGSEVLGYKYQSTVGAEGTTEITDVEMKTGNAQVAVVANAPEGAFGGVANYTEFEAKVVELASQSQENLTMSSQLLSVTFSNPEDNYIGYAGQTNVSGLNSPILLTRVSARIDMVSVRTNFAGSILEGRQVKVNSVWLENVKTASRYFSAADWGIVEIPGNMSSGQFAKGTIDRTVDATTIISDTPYHAYVMENGAGEGGATRLMIDATLQTSIDYRAEHKIFAVTINENGKSKGYNHNFIKRNYVYELGITFGKNSFEGEVVDPNPPIPPIDYASLEVIISVVNWGIVYQNPVID